ncbi:hypothetical protein [Herbiconiux sp. VKM Ac-2851]|uniref:hypothetical protein n=1 Tax=Herbiconiux sp. VKM Ac-2851 TaxID=2739025 RepID=UPI0015652DD4|nr:hypothetical protein [Herbiconiux sp. VKM Ac-2851]NQX35472.1 hypothetical protein [Herbiconiux sp. VKM Ac-2851]
MTDLHTIALALDDGYGLLVARREELKAAAAQKTADYPRQPDPADVARSFLDGGPSLREAAEREVQGRRVLADILDLEQTYLNSAQAVLRLDTAAWLDAHQPELCEGFHEARIDVQTRAARLLAPGNPHPDAARALATEWNELRSEHTSLIGVELIAGSLVWRGLDWVDDYAAAWPEFFLWTPLDTQIEGAPRRVYGPAQRPFDPETHSTSDLPVGDRLTPIEQLQQLTEVKVWTPTKQQYSTRTALLDDLSHRRRYEFVKDAKRQHEEGKRIHIAPVVNPVTTTRPDWMR